MIYRVVVSAIAASLCLLLGLYIFLKDRNNPRSRYFFNFNLSLFVWNSSDFIGPFVNRIIGITEYYRFSYLGAILLIPSFIYLIINVSGYRSRFNLVPMMWAISVLFLVVLPTSLIINGVKLDLTYQETPGPWFPFFATYFLFFFFYGLYVLYAGYRISEVGQKKRLLIFFVGLAIGFVCACVAFFLISIKRANHSYVAIYVFEILYSGFLAYGVAKHNLMDIKVVINKAGAFVVTALIFIAGYLGLVLPYRAFISTAIDLKFIGISSAYCIFLVGLYFHRVQRFLQTSAYKKFLKFDYDFDETLKSVSSQLILAQNTADVIDTIMLMQDSLEIGQCYAFLRRDETSSEFECYRIERTKDAQEKPGKTLLGTYDVSHPFLTWLEDHFDKVKRVETLEPRIQAFLKTLGVSTDSICMSIDSFKAFQAVFIIGQRLNEERYQDKDLALFEVIANQAVIVFERITQAHRLMGQQSKLEKLNIQLQASNTELESKVKESVSLAQKHFHQAAFATLTSGMAHEIRNPMAAILGTAQFLAEAMGAHYEGSKQSVRDPAMVWNRPITSADFVGLLNGDQEKATSILEALVDRGFVSPEGALTDQVDIVSGDMSTMDLGAVFAGDTVFIESMMKRLAQTALLIEFINVVSHHIPRLLEITETMMRYGISGGGIKVDSFAKINGIMGDDSGLIFDTLRGLGYLDERGGVLPQFNLNDPGIATVLAGHFPEHIRRFSRDIVTVVQSTPGAVKQVLSIVDVLQNTLNLIEGSCHKQHIAVHREFEQDLPLIAGDAHRLQQAFFNIVFNAVQAMDGPENRDRRLKVKVARAQFTGVGGTRVDGIEIQFEDTGPGISPETKANIFNPFFTTKDPAGGQNIGLGLSILYEVISGHGGYIEVESELGKGTVFKVMLPHCATPPNIEKGNYL